MDSQVRHYEKEYELLSCIDRVFARIENLYKKCVQWQSNYGMMMDSSLMHRNIRFYDDILNFLNGAKSKLRQVYEQAVDSDNDLSKELGLITDQLRFNNSTLKALRDMINDNPVCFNMGIVAFGALLGKATAINPKDLEAMIAYYSEDERWKELLQKDASELTDAEYQVLASIFVTLDETQMEEFLNGCFVEVGKEEKDIFLPKQTYYACTYWNLDKIKIKQLAEAMKAISNREFWTNLVEYDTCEDKNKVMEEREVFLQKSMVFQALIPIEQVTSSDDGALSINLGDDLTISYNKETYSPYYSTNMDDQTIVIKDPAYGVDVQTAYYSLFEDDFKYHYGEPAMVGAFNDMIIESILSGAVGEIPKIGGIAGTALSLLMDTYSIIDEYSDNMEFFAETKENFKNANIASHFSLYGTAIVYSDQTIESYIDLQPGYDTYNTIYLYNNLVPFQECRESCGTISYDLSQINLEQLSNIIEFKGSDSDYEHFRTRFFNKEEMTYEFEEVIR